jgi:hypothetical protein
MCFSTIFFIPLFILDQNFYLVPTGRNSINRYAQQRAEFFYAFS